MCFGVVVVAVRRPKDLCNDHICCCLCLCSSVVVVVAVAAVVGIRYNVVMVLSRKVRNLKKIKN